MYPTYGDFDADVVIIGAGVSGISTAFYILEYEPTMKILILEASDHIGGRILSLPLTINNKNELKMFDFGGQFISLSQIHLAYLIDRLDLQLTKLQNTVGLTIWNLYENDLTKTLQSGFVIQNIDERMELENFFLKIKRLSEQVICEKPQKSQESKKYDEETMDNFIKLNLRITNTRSFVRIVIKVTCGVEPSEINVSFFLALYKSTQGQLLFGEKLLIKGGADQICQKIASKIGRHNIKTNERVLEVMHNKSSVVIETEESVYRTKFVIVAIPPKQVLSIVFDPPLAEIHTELLKMFKTGNLVKFVVTYTRAFWKDKYCSGDIISCGKQGGHGPISICLNLSSNNYFALSGCIAASDCESSSHKDKVLQQLAVYFGQEALNPLDYKEKLWNDEPYINGYVMTNTGVGNMSNYSKIMQPIGRLYWAGTETAVLWNGQMGVAVQAAYRAAIEMLYDYRPQVLQSADIAFISSKKEHFSSNIVSAQQKLLLGLKEKPTEVTKNNTNYKTHSNVLRFEPQEPDEVASLSFNPEESRLIQQPEVSHYLSWVVPVVVLLGYFYFKLINS